MSTFEDAAELLDEGDLQWVEPPAVAAEGKPSAIAILLIADSAVTLPHRVAGH